MIKAFHSLMTKLLAAAVALTAVCCVAACAKDKPAEENVEIKLSETEIELTEGETYRLTVTVTPADAQDKKIEWRVSDPLVATVEDGVITAVKAGETTVTASTNEKTASCKVTVKAKEDSSEPGSDSGSGSASDSEGEGSGEDSESGSESGSEENGSDEGGSENR